MRLKQDEEILSAVDYWIQHGRQKAVAESQRLDEAVKQFGDWLDGCELRDLSRRNLKLRVNIFANSVPNLRVADVTPDTIDDFLKTRSGVSAKTRDNDRRAVS